MKPYEIIKFNYDGIDLFITFIDINNIRDEMKVRVTPSMLNELYMDQLAYGTQPTLPE